MKSHKGDIWLKSEGDNWFRRNKIHSEKKKDLTMLLLDLYNIKPKRVLDVGCSNGHRLAALHEKYGADVIGVEPSKKAIEDGKKKWPFIKFNRAMSNSFEIKNKVDLVICNFVFHWISRRNLVKSVAKIDEALEEGGVLLIEDFGTKSFIKKKYHHLPRKNLFTYKQQYQDIFISMGTYKEIAKLTFNHDTKEVTLDTDYTNVGTISLLKKSEFYSEDVSF